VALLDGQIAHDHLGLGTRHSGILFIKLIEQSSNRAIEQSSNRAIEGVIVVTLEKVLAAYQKYIDGRNALLDELNLSQRSNRDPLSEFSEWLVAALVDGKLAESRVQKGWDVSTASDEKIQVKYLANPADRWVNEHHIVINEYMTAYALVLYEALLPTAVIIFPVTGLQKVGMLLGKKHGNLETTIQFTRQNYHRIKDNPATFAGLGVRLYLAPDWKLQE